MCWGISNVVEFAMHIQIQQNVGGQVAKKHKRWRGSEANNKKKINKGVVKRYPFDIYPWREN